MFTLNTSLCPFLPVNKSALLLLLFFLIPANSFSGEYKSILSSSQPLRTIQEQPGESDSSKDETSAILQLGNKHLESLRTEGQEEQAALVNTVEYLRQLPEVTDAGLSDDGATIWVRSAMGVQGLLITRSMEDNPESQSASQPESAPQRTVVRRVEPQYSSPFDNSLISSSRSLFRDNGTNAPKALIIEPYDNTGSGGLADQYPEQIGNTLASAGYKITHIQNKDAGVEQFSTMNQYDIIYIYTHCGTIQKQTSWMTGEEVTAEKTRKYKKLYGDGVAIGKVGGKAGYCITPAFFKKVKGFPGSVVYVNGCNSNADPKNNPMGKALKQAGASEYLGYDFFVLKDFATYNTDLDFFKYLTIHGLSIDEALNKKPSRFYGRSHNFFKGKIRPKGINPGFTIPVDSAKRIEMLKAEHRALQEELNSINNIIQANMHSSQVDKLSYRMDVIRHKQKEIFARVKLLRQG